MRFDKSHLISLAAFFVAGSINAEATTPIEPSMETIPADSYEMGSERAASSQPVHTATLKETAMGTPAFANTDENQIIAQLRKTYGGDTLMSARAITLTDYTKSPWAGQGGTPEHPDFFRDHAELTIDFEGKRKSLLSWRVSRASVDLDRFVFDGDSGRVYDLLNKKYTPDNWYIYATTGRSVIRRSDTMIARALVKAPGQAVYVGESFYRGALHHVMDITLHDGAAYQLYINTDTGFISKMARQHPRAGEIKYVFSNHQTSDGVTYAQDLNVFIGGKVNQISTKRHIKLNPDLADMFNEPEGYAEWGATIDSSEMSVRQIAEGVYHVGKGRSFTLFVDAGDHFVGAGGERGLAESYSALKEQTGLDKPLRHQVITHVHSEHLPTASAAADLGATLVTASGHTDATLEHLPAQFPADRLQAVTDRMTLAKSKIELFNIATAHSEEYLLVYVPAAKVVFAEDHYETQLKTALPRVHRDMVTFGKRMQELGLDVDMLLDGHSARILSIEEFQQATNDFTLPQCPVGYRICANG